MGAGETQDVAWLTHMAYSRVPRFTTQLSQEDSMVGTASCRTYSILSELVYVRGLRNERALSALHVSSVCACECTLSGAPLWFRRVLTLAANVLEMPLAKTQCTDYTCCSWH